MISVMREYARSLKIVLLIVIVVFILTSGVLFYFALAVCAITGLHDTATLALAWAFVAARVVHSAIHCSYNKVMHRFRAYLLGAAILLALWVRVAWHLLAG